MVNSATIMNEVRHDAEALHEHPVSGTDTPFHATR